MISVDVKCFLVPYSKAHTTSSVPPPTMPAMLQWNWQASSP